MCHWVKNKKFIKRNHLASTSSISTTGSRLNITTIRGIWERSECPTINPWSPLIYSYQQNEVNNMIIIIIIFCSILFQLEDQPTNQPKIFDTFSKFCQPVFVVELLMLTLKTVVEYEYFKDSLMFWSLELLWLCCIFFGIEFIPTWCPSVCLLLVLAIVALTRSKQHHPGTRNNSRYNTPAVAAAKPNAAFYCSCCCWRFISETLAMTLMFIHLRKIFLNAFRLFCFCMLPLSRRSFLGDLV